MFWKKSNPTEAPQWLIVGLGNPGPAYRRTRHNVGFEVVDLLAAEGRIKLDRSKYRSRYGLGSVGGVSACLMKPLTFMNLSGQAVAPAARAWGIAPDRILVIADDLDLPVGKLRLRLDGSAGGHNGHKSLIHSLGTQGYPRLKIGIGAPGRGETIDHVLSGFPPEERSVVDAAIRSAAEVVVAMLEAGYEAAVRVVEHHNQA